MKPIALKVLDALNEGSAPDGEYCVGFDFICREVGTQDRAFIRREVRKLARAGLAEYHKGLWTEDGEMAGAGYCISRAGRQSIANK